MAIRHKVVWLVGGGLLVVMLASGTVQAFLITQANAPHYQPRPTLAPTELATAKALYDNQRQQQLSQPYATTPPRTPDLRILGTPVPTLSPGTKPAWATIVRAIRKPELVQVHAFRYASSIWQNGAVSNDDGTEWYKLYVYTMDASSDKAAGLAVADGTALIATLPFDAPDEVEQRYHQTWESPRPIKQLTITGITGGTHGVVVFTTETGSGTLDMATGTWTFNP